MAIDTNKSGPFGFVTRYIAPGGHRIPVPTPPHPVRPSPRPYTNTPFGTHWYSEKLESHSPTTDYTPGCWHDDVDYCSQDLSSLSSLKFKRPWGKETVMATETDYEQTTDTATVTETTTEKPDVHREKKVTVKAPQQVLRAWRRQENALEPNIQASDSSDFTSTSSSDSETDDETYQTNTFHIYLQPSPHAHAPDGLLHNIADADGIREGSNEGKASYKLSIDGGEQMKEGESPDGVHQERTNWKSEKEDFEGKWEESEYDGMEIESN
ncbi:uncharacterized protein BDR25DRAFT_306770 [Lindgomyces ingoldianus]|uniref:Uncharacterized protein n=1 Tax=Lindgomyces ingoldianus TaxID=673940 RepID=A0ACB6QGR4_9PLEO|nr:uncharacterized protein BDR25DRAFT_306770 [Lindgomyces ingoldianus]KAF2465336.1 hypothetical protein BDR25DRAFT_306770 [Lindgomyces ingoldianus]